MDEDFDRLTTTLREIARDDAAHAPSRLDPRIVAELRLRRRPAAGQARLLGFGIAAALAAAMAGALWAATRLPRLGGAPALTGHEITTSFMPLTYSALPYTDAQIVRLEVPRRALASFGLAPADLPADVVAAGAQTTVLADVLVGEDGLARAVRFVRPERASQDEGR